jgi:hypothetical protein
MVNAKSQTNLMKKEIKRDYELWFVLLDFTKHIYNAVTIKKQSIMQEGRSGEKKW